MYEYYTINHVALMTGLSTRTIRNYMKQGLLEGEMINGMWHFTADQFAAFIAQPPVAAAVRTRRNALVYDFLADDYKRDSEICTILDLPAAPDQANAVSEFFCHTINTEPINNIQFTFSFGGARLRVILKGSAESVMQLLSRYHAAFPV